MYRQEVMIPSIGWDVVICYDVRPHDGDIIAYELEKLRCPWHDISRAKSLVESGHPNEGLTYSNERMRRSLIAVGHTSDFWQFIDTVSHEKQHLEQSVCRAFSLDPYGEDIAYISGDISAAIARNAWRTMKKLFLYLI